MVCFPEKGRITGTTGANKRTGLPPVWLSLRALQRLDLMPAKAMLSF